MRISATLSNVSNVQRAFQSSANHTKTKAGAKGSALSALSAPVKVSASLMKRSQLLQKAMVGIQLQMLGHTPS